ncbi:hypothetical protein HYPSUDRAFT_141909 [Hypholoma sublateritium FD-334 SS-4]|uniref:Uncharacterized protein n=1 Tax=Hypholoma sublateritium (strain FD-334 SS-4) TaxID=945553 RepID=A0A0D2PL16_HYPSF|nr:hypothetical protein HYPSUDRAFT_141909 [Hypholoma sublateritium FD-334 SS-4]
MASIPIRAPFDGPRRKLVLAFDIGTTFSGISYSVLDPGRVPEIKGITKFPAQDHISGASKIPTIIYYDRNGDVRAVGAEAMRDGIQDQAEDEQWVKAEWFKLHLRSRLGPGAGREITAKIPPLPLNKTVIEILADFMVYLLSCASKYITETHANGVDLWTSVKDQIDFVLSHPNGWEGTQQSQMRSAAILARLIPDTSAGNARLSFVTEGEASLHFAIQNGLPSGALNRGEGIVIVDAGGGTIDISSYSKNMTSTAAKVSFEEIATSQCHFQGSVFVNENARSFLQSYLADSPYVDDIDHITRCFDKTTKPRFRDAKEPQYIKFGSIRDNDASVNIRSGQLKLQGADVALFFQPPISCIAKAVQDQRQTAHKNIHHVILVGGFAASDYLLVQLTEALRPAGLSIVRPESHVNKAVSDGAISFYLDHFVRTRVSKFAYGTFCDDWYRPEENDHRARVATLYTDFAGTKRIPDRFDIILPKNTQISEQKEFRNSFSEYFDESHRFSDIYKSEVWCYRGLVTQPKWKDVDRSKYLPSFAYLMAYNYTKLCTVDVKLSGVPLTQLRKADGSGTYHVMTFDIILIFGLTELKAQVAWQDKTVSITSSAKIVYDPDIYY